MQDTIGLESFDSTLQIYAGHADNVIILIQQAELMDSLSELRKALWKRSWQRIYWPIFKKEKKSHLRDWKEKCSDHCLPNCSKKQSWQAIHLLLSTKHFKRICNSKPIYICLSRPLSVLTSWWSLTIINSMNLVSLWTVRWLRWTWDGKKKKTHLHW